jgi:putative phosphoesterase
MSLFMQKIGLLSDTHGYFDPRLFDLFKEVDQIWHAGDLGSEDLLTDIETFKPCRVVYGNIDDWGVRSRVPEHQRFICEGVEVWITHIGGYPGRYAPQVKAELLRNPPALFISGHSHILKVMHDKTIDCLHMNPGAAGKSGFHTIRTALRFVIEDKQIKDLEIIELGSRV